MKRNIKLKQSFKNLNGDDRVNSLSAYINRDNLMILFTECGPEKKASIGLDRASMTELRDFINGWLSQAQMPSS